MAQDELDYLTGDEATRRLAELKEKWILDYNSGITSAVEQGEKEEKVEIAKKMLIKGLDLELIIDITELTIDEIEKIKNNINQ